MCNQETLLRELDDAAKNWNAMDGLWFLAVEDAYGMDAAIALDKNVWEQFSKIEAERIKKRLSLPEFGGIDALERALAHRLSHRINKQEIQRDGEDTLILVMKSCRVQAARERKGLQPFPCKPVGLVEYTIFAKTIDPRVRTECVSCPPETVPGTKYCAWKFTLHAKG
ncbi:MAG: DUF6125 family protein [Methanoregula sp.]|nr:MAG: DUF6125 family protein [Methanoregula sp.]